MRSPAFIALILLLSCSTLYAESTSTTLPPPKTTAGKTIAEQYHITKIWAFGDSLTDTGNKLTINEKYDPCRATNRCDATDAGKLWVEFFADRLGLPAPTPSGHRKMKRSSELSGGTNYAIMGARIAGDGSGDVPQQITAYLAKHKPKPTDLFCINGGANDTVNRKAIRSMTKMREEGVFNIGDEARVANGMIQQVARLADAGAKRIMIQSVPDLGMTPVATIAGMGTMATAWSKKVNELVKPALDKIEASHDVDIFYIDSFLVMHELRDQREEYGIKAVLQSYCVGDPHKKFWLRTHVSDGPTSFSGTPCTPSECLFWDPVHPTTKGHECMGELIFREFYEQLKETAAK